jgi:hypothetical protein
MFKLTSIEIIFLVLVALFSTSVRPAHASGTVSMVQTYEYYTNVCNSHWYTVLSDLRACDLAYENNHYATSGSIVDAGGTPTPSNGNASFDYRIANGTHATFDYIFTQNYVMACPANSTGSTTCTCTNPYIANSGATACIMPPCPATGTVHSAGFYDLGTVDNADNHPPINTCDSSCSMSYEGGAQAYRALVGGVYHYFAKGAYYADSTINNGTCTGGVQSVGSTSALPTDTCGSGQSLVTGSNGYSKCFNDSTGDAVDPNSTAAASAVAAAQTAAQQAAATAAKQAAASAAGAAGGDAAAQAAAGAAAAGAAAGQIAADQAAQKSQCETNPNSMACLELGNPPSAESIPGSTPTFDGSPIAFASGSSSCPAPFTFTLTMPIIAGTYNISVQPLCDFAALAKPIFLALAAISAAFIFSGVLI